MITNLEQLLPLAQQKRGMKLSVACPYDAHTVMAVQMAQKEGLVKPIFVGNQSKIKSAVEQFAPDFTDYDILDIANDETAVVEAVKIVSTGNADMLMKGLISSEKYLKAILNRHNGLLSNSPQITHVTVLQNSRLQKLVIFGDSAIIPNPDLKQKLVILNALESMANVLGIAKPKISIIAATELISNAIEAGVDAAIISKMSDRGQLNCIADGPMSIDIAIDPETANIKGINGPIKGDADCLLFPNIEAGNAFYKSATKLGGSEIAGCLSGTKSPVVMTSRADSTLSKYYSILIAMVTSAPKR